MTNCACEHLSYEVGPSILLNFREHRSATKQLNKTIRIATPNTVASTHLEIQFGRVRHAFSGDGATRRLEQLGVVRYSVGVMIRD